MPYPLVHVGISVPKTEPHPSKTPSLAHVGGTRFSQQGRYFRLSIPRACGRHLYRGHGQELKIEFFKLLHRASIPRACGRHYRHESLRYSYPPAPSPQSSVLHLVQLLYPASSCIQSVYSQPAARSPALLPCCPAVCSLPIEVHRPLPCRAL